MTNLMKKQQVTFQNIGSITVKGISSKKITETKSEISNKKCECDIDREFIIFAILWSILLHVLVVLFIKC